MEIIVVDLETTGFIASKDAIVEIGIVLVDTKAKTIKTLFDKVVKDDRFDAKKDAKKYIFENSTLTVEDVENAESLEDNFDEIQKILTKYKMTAYNKPFDIRFLKAAGFKVKDVKCLMKSSRPYSTALGKNGKKKTPSVEDMYNQFFVEQHEDEYIEDHRAGQDARDEAKILLKLVDLKAKGVTSKDKDVVVVKNKKPQSNHPTYLPMGPHDKFKFGKHKDKLFSDVVKTEPWYITWCVEKVRTFKLTNDAKLLLEKTKKK